MKKTLLITLTYLLLVGCGYKVINKSEKTNFTVEEIIFTGDKRIGNRVNRNISIYFKENSKNLLSITLDSQKEKIIKEKNIKNQITKYEIKITVNLKINVINKNIEKYIRLSSYGDYLVGENNSDTRNNELSLMENLISNISEDVYSELISNIDDI
jgi:hypothetical protein